MKKLTVYEVEQRFNDLAREIAEEFDVDDDFYGDHWPREYQSIMSLCAVRGVITDEDLEEARAIMVSCATSEVIE